MRPRSSSPILPCVLSALLLGCGSSGGGSSPSPQPDAGQQEDPGDWIDALKANESCILECSATCTEAKTPWTCPALAAWDAIPHDPTACGTFDGGTLPQARRGQVHGHGPVGAGAPRRRTPSGTPVVLPDGRRVEPAGNEWVFTDFPGGFPDGRAPRPAGVAVAASSSTPATRRTRCAPSSTALALAVVDGRTPSPPASATSRPKALNWGMAYVAASKHAATWRAATTAPTDTDSQIFAYDFDPARRQAHGRRRRRPSRCPRARSPQGLAVSPDGQHAARRAGDRRPRAGRQPGVGDVRHRSPRKIDARAARRLRDPLRPERSRRATPRTRRSGSTPRTASNANVMPLSQLDLSTMTSTDHRRRQGARGHGVPRRAVHGRRQRAVRRAVDHRPSRGAWSRRPCRSAPPASSRRASPTTRLARGSTPRSPRRTRSRSSTSTTRRRRRPSCRSGASRRRGGRRRSRSTDRRARST